jgi:predicted RecA/RadA family phage recombinase
MRNLVHQPGDMITVTAPNAVTAGQGVLVGTLFGVAMHDAASGAPVDILTTGVVDIAKASGVAVTAGARVFWVPGTNNVNTTATSQVNVGVAIQAAASGDATVRIKLGANTPSGT